MSEHHVSFDGRAMKGCECFESQPKITGYRCSDYSQLEHCIEIDRGIVDDPNGEKREYDVRFWIECE